MAKTIIGKVSFTPKGTYDASQSYDRLDVIEYNGSSFVALKTVTGVTPTDDKINYQLLAKRGIDGTTPQKGTDYYTEAEKAEIIDTIVASLPNGDKIAYGDGVKY